MNNKQQQKLFNLERPAKECVYMLKRYVPIKTAAGYAVQCTKTYRLVATELTEQQAIGICERLNSSRGLTK